MNLAVYHLPSCFFLQRKLQTSHMLNNLIAASDDFHCCLSLKTSQSEQQTWCKKVDVLEAIESPKTELLNLLGGSRAVSATFKMFLLK